VHCTVGDVGAVFFVDPIVPFEDDVRLALKQSVFRQIQLQEFRQFLLPINRFGIFHGRLDRG